MHRLVPVSLLTLALGAAACAPVGDSPSLAPRAAEAIDPRLPVADRSGELAADPAFVAAVAGLSARARAAASAAEPAIRRAEAQVGSAGARESESWIAAQQAVSAAIAERAAFARLLGDLDALIAQRVRGGGRLVPRDLAAAQGAAEELAAIDRRQSDTLAAMQRRLQR